MIHPYHGLLPYSVFLIPLAFAAVVGWRAAPDWARLSVVAGFCYWALQLRGNRFTGGFNFVGYRFPLEPLWLMAPILVIGYAERARQSALFRRATMVFVALSIGWMVALIIFSPKGYMYKPRTDQPAPQTETASAMPEVTT